MDLPLPTTTGLLPAALPSPRPPRPHAPWVPKRVLVTPAALSWPQGEAMAERAAALDAEKKARALALAAEQKAARDARYAARKARRR